MGQITFDSEAGQREGVFRDHGHPPRYPRRPEMKMGI